MARATTPTLLSLDEFQSIIGIDPLHFNQVVAGSVNPLSDDQIDPATLPDMPMLQYSWQQDDHIGREEIAQAIAMAEANIMDHCGFALRPTWAYDELVQLRRPTDVTTWDMMGIDGRGGPKPIQARWGLFIAGGRESKDLVQANAPITYSDADGDGYFETATVAVGTNVTDPSEIAVYYPGQFADDTFEIRPKTVSINVNSGIATVVFRREQAVELQLLEAFNSRAVEGLIPTSGPDADFIQTVDVYRHWSDPSTQIVTEWSQPFCVLCGGTGCQACTALSGGGCLTPIDSQIGIVSITPGTWDTVNGGFTTGLWAGTRYPDRVRLYYKHGWRPGRRTNLNVQSFRDAMDPLVARVVAGYAVALLDRPLANKSTLRAFQGWMQEDLALRTAGGGESSSYALGARVLDNPFGTQRGAVMAWEWVARNKLGNAK